MPVFKQWVLSGGKCGGTKEISEDDFDINEDHAPDLSKGEILCRALFLSVDPITSLYMTYSMQPGDIFPGRQVARVVESKNKEFPKGRLVCGSMGWQTYSVVDPEVTQEMCGHTVKLIDGLPRQLDWTNLSKSACLGVLGIPGLTAYLALTEACRAKAGETVVISSAAGQIGHLAGQIGKLLGLKVIGYTRDADKASWMKTELGYDWAFNQTTQDVRQTLKISTAVKSTTTIVLPDVDPDEDEEEEGGSGEEARRGRKVSQPSGPGVDIFIDSVGGVFHSMVMEHMKNCGRVCVLGNLAYYNPSSSGNCGGGSTIPMVPANDLAVSLKGLTIMGFNVYKYADKFDKALNQLTEWCKSGDLKPYEHIVEGFENMPKAFIDQLSGKSQGKVIVRV